MHSNLRHMLRFTVAATLAATIWPAAADTAEPELVNVLSLPGESVDLTRLKQGQTGGANVNRQGFFSDLFYDPHSEFWYALSDRGPGGGLLSYETRLQRFTLKIRTDGRISHYELDKTIRFVDDSGAPFNGRNPRLLNGNAAMLGNSFDPEGLVVGRNGHFFVSDEYGPSLYEFDRKGRFIRAFEPPANLLPKEATGVLNFVDGRPTIATGRQDNRGYEGLTINPWGTKLYAILQDPLVNEGSPDGRRSRNVRIVEFDTESGQSERQFIYELDSLADINARTADTGDDFGANAQGRNIGVSAILALNSHEFLVLERDNRGFGGDESILKLATPPQPAPPSLHKRVYRIDIADTTAPATDVSGISLHNTNTVPAGVTPVKKALFLDVLSALQQAGQPVPEKLEGLAIGPRLRDHRRKDHHGDDDDDDDDDDSDGDDRVILFGTDNDFSVTQNADTTEQFDVCAQVTGAVVTYVSNTIPINSPCPAGSALIPALLMSFTGPVPGFVEPGRRWRDRRDDWAWDRD